MNQELEVTSTEIVNFQMLEESDLSQAKFIFDTIDVYVKRYLKNKIDYGTIPYCGNKKVLFKAGAEKLCRLFKLRPTFELVDKIIDYDQKIFHYHYRCTLYRFGELIGQCDGVANSKERKFSGGNRGFDFTTINTIVKMSQKRAMVGAVLIVCGASEYFTQDLEDYN